MRRGRRICRNAFVFIFLAALTTQAVWTVIAPASRFSWGMFSHVLDYSLDYQWLFADGPPRAHVPGDELRGTARRLAVRSPRTTSQDVGVVSSWVRSYLRYAWDTARPPDAVRIEALLRYVVDGGEARVRRIRYPPDDAR